MAVLAALPAVAMASDFGGLANAMMVFAAIGTALVLLVLWFLVKLVPQRWLRVLILVLPLSSCWSPLVNHGNTRPLFLYVVAGDGLFWQALGSFVGCTAVLFVIGLGFAMPPSTPAAASDPTDTPPPPAPPARRDDPWP